ncbi:hypothetical protein FF38_10504 [Lucilia cuprina]|uniref:Uncharacterized protein n=1 Tax=Lucilia cuprina TaxID=7375 RepID=A0A0L0CG70_LUCCU|nr:hypothetical protein FF38_10504 [Lucilia cuprina]
MTTNPIVSPTGVNTLASFGSAMLGGISGYLAGLPTGVLVCAIFGATFYIVINHNNLSWKKQLFFFFMSFYIGTTDAAMVMALIMSKSLSKAGIEYEVDIAVGALVVSAGAQQFKRGLIMRDSIEYCLGFIGRSAADVSLSNGLSYFNAVVCLLIALRLMTYQRNGATHRWFISFASWVIVSATLASAALTFTGKYLFVHPYEIVINVAFCAAIWFAKGLCGFFFNGKREAELKLANFQRTSLENYINSLNTSVSILMDGAKVIQKLNQEQLDATKENDDETRRLNDAIAAGTVRVRFLTSELTKAKARNSLRETGQCHDESGITLGTDDGLRISNTRNSIKADKIQIDYLKGYIRYLEGIIEKHNAEQ